MQNMETADMSANVANADGGRDCGPVSPKFAPKMVSARAQLRFLHALAQHGAYACPDILYPDTRLRLVAPCKGISLGGITAGVEVGEVLVAQDFARWQRARNSRAKRLFINEVGHSYLARCAAAGADAFRFQHQPLGKVAMEVDGRSESVRVNLAESPLAWLARRKNRAGIAYIQPAQLAAGERLRADLTRASLLPQMTARWGAPTGNAGAARGAVQFSENVIAARQRVQTALRNVGAEAADLLMDVCGFLKGLEQIEQERGWPRRSAKHKLGRALTKLADHYGIGSQAMGRINYGKISHWGDAEYRPNL